MKNAVDLSIYFINTALGSYNTKFEYSNDNFNTKLGR